MALAYARAIFIWPQPEKESVMARHRKVSHLKKGGRKRGGKRRGRGKHVIK